MNRVVVTGIGMVSPLAANVNDTWNQLLQSKSGINRITSFNTDDLNVKIAGQIPSSEEQFGFNADNFVKSHSFDYKKPIKITDRNKILLGMGFINEEKTSLHPKLVLNAK